MSVQGTSLRAAPSKRLDLISRILILSTSSPIEAEISTWISPDAVRLYFVWLTVRQSILLIPVSIG